MTNFKKYIKTKNRWMYNNYQQRMVNQPEIVNHIKNNPGEVENEIMYNIYGYDRNSSPDSNKKYADCLRRALGSGKISRKFVKRGNRNTYIYFVD